LALRGNHRVARPTLTRARGDVQLGLLLGSRWMRPLLQSRAWLGVAGNAPAAWASAGMAAPMDAPSMALPVHFLHVTMASRKPGCAPSDTGPSMPGRPYGMHAGPSRHSLRGHPVLAACHNACPGYCRGTAGIRGWQGSWLSICAGEACSSCAAMVPVPQHKICQVVCVTTPNSPSARDWGSSAC
jgi:hypothetical protein